MTAASICVALLIIEGGECLASKTVGGDLVLGPRHSRLTKINAQIEATSTVTNLWPECSDSFSPRRLRGKSVWRKRLSIYMARSIIPS